MPPEPTTVYRVEAAGCDGPTSLFTTEHTPEDNACANEGNASMLVLSAFSDGTNMTDPDGTVVAWTNWPPADFTP